MVNEFLNFGYEDLLTSVKGFVAVLAIVFLEFQFRIKFFRGIALLNAILLQIFQNKIKISPPVLLINITEN